MIDDKRPLRIGVWCAVSSQAQAAEDKVSLDDQEQAGREFAAAVGGEVVAVYRVPGHSRDIIFYHDAERAMAAYADLHRDVDAETIDVLFAVDEDRLGRDPALIQQVVSLVEHTRRRDGTSAEVYLSTSPHVVGEKTEAHRYITAIKGVRASEDQKRRRQMHRAGMKGRIEKRGLLPGRPPFYLEPVRDPISGDVVGYQFSDQVAALDLMTELFLTGHSYAEIRRRLDASPHPPPGKGQNWWHRVVWETLRSDVAAGYPAWGGYRAARPSDKFPARWNGETHAAVIRERQRRARGPYHRKGSGPLAGIAVCARCGVNMSRQRAGHGQARYLRCSRHAQRSVYRRYQCHPNYIKEATAIAAVADFLQDLSTPAAVEAALEGAGDDSGAAELEGDLATTQTAAGDLESRRMRLAHALAAGSVDAAIYRQVDDDLQAQLATKKKKAAELRRAIAALPDLEERQAALESAIDSFPGILETSEPAEISSALDKVGLRLLVEEGEIVLVGLTA